MTLQKRFKNTYKKVVVDKRMLKGAAAGLLLARIGNDKSNNLELMGLATVVHLGGSALATAILIGVDADEYYVEHMD